MTWTFLMYTHEKQNKKIRNYAVIFVWRMDRHTIFAIFVFVFLSPWNWRLPFRRVCFEIHWQNGDFLHFMKWHLPIGELPRKWPLLYSKSVSSSSSKCVPLLPFDNPISSHNELSDGYSNVDVSTSLKRMLNCCKEKIKKTHEHFLSQKISGHQTIKWHGSSAW